MQGRLRSRTIPAIFIFLMTALAFAQSPSAPSGQLESLARAVSTEATEAAYARLAEFAAKNSGNESGAQAALALGSAEQTRRRNEAAMQWYQKAEKSEVLREYALYFGAEAARSAAKEEQAIARLERLRREFPSSVLTGSAVEDLANAALAVGQPAKALTALEGAPVAATPSLLLLRARAQQQAGHSEQAAVDYNALYYGYPLSSDAKTAGAVLASLRRTMGAKFPKVALEQQLARADALLDRSQCREARAEYGGLLPQLTGPARDRAQLRIAQCRVKAGAPATVLSDLKVSDPEVNAERVYVLSQTYRSRRQESAMLKAVEQVAREHPQSRWAEEALFSTGNYYWIDLKRAQAAGYYRRAVDQFPTGRNVASGQWRLAWTTYLERPEQAGPLFEEHLTRFRSTPFAENALYWLGRIAERAGDKPRARAFYGKAAERYTQTYYGRQAGERLRAIGTGSTAEVEVLGRIPAASAATAMDASIPPAAEPYRRRAQALMALGFEPYAEQELRAAFVLTRAPRVLLEAAQAAHQASRHGVGIVIARRLDPDLDSRRLAEAPEEVWRAVYPLPYQSSIETTAGRKGLDPMLVAGLIRQESTFLPGAVSRAGAVGLMQVLPRTGRVLARRERLAYSRTKLFQPDYNLRLGTNHLAQLVSSYGSVEKALAAYNAGEHRVAAWTAKGDYSEPAEFVESIPFTETREYVQIVMRNAEVYRRLYPPSGKSSSKTGGQ